MGDNWGSALRFRNRENQRSRGVFMLFISNLPTKLHWTGLRQTFGRHDDLVDAYVANKKDKQGRRFGFFRFSNQRDADRALERLNGFHLYGFKLRVMIARFNIRTTYWKRKKWIPKQARQRGVNHVEVKPTGETERVANQSQEIDKGAMII
ncbi:hypothetical protein V6N13_072163 [Hibiscus sabdariffa]